MKNSYVIFSVMIVMLIASCAYLAKSQDKKSDFIQFKPDTRPVDIVIKGNATDYLVKIYTDGSIEYGKDYKPDEAAKVFWSAIGGYKQECEELRKENEELKDKLKVIYPLSEKK